MKFFFLGLENRFNENCDLFKDIKVTYKTGLKSFKGIGTFNNGKVSYNFNGITKDFSIKELLNVISLEAEKYDSLVLTSSERGSELTISCDNKDVKMNTKEIETSKILDEHNDTSSLLNRNYLIKSC